MPDTTTATRTRYRVLALAVLLAGITYLDRICIAITAPYMMEELGLSKVQMSWVFSAFTLAYGLFEIPTGHWGDTVGTRRVLTRIVIWWSTFTVMTATVFSYSSLLVIRFLFGAGEAGAWPNVARTFSRWFPLTERSTAQGIFFMGAHLAGGLTPALVTFMLTLLPWRALFVVFGSIGFFWAAAWYWWFRDEPSEHPQVNAAERALIERGRIPSGRHELTLKRWAELFSNPTIVGLCAMYFTQSYGFMFYITWFPTYLKTVRGFNDSAVFSILAGLPLTFSVAADLFGGITADRASRRYGLRLGRALTGGISLAAAGLFLIAGVYVPNNYLSALLIGLGGGASAFLLGAAWATCLDVGGHHAGLVGAAMNTSGQVGAFLSPLVVGYMGGWETPMYLVGLLYLLGAACWIRIDPTQPIWSSPEPVKT
ncbi:MAG: MFS transporter [Bryobacterales bacterium]|nr:MFS transporter [Bryobacterales bacterium]